MNRKFAFPFSNKLRWEENYFFLLKFFKKVNKYLNNSPVGL